MTSNIIRNLKIFDLVPETFYRIVQFSIKTSSRKQLQKMADSQKMLKMRPQAINSKLFDPNCNILEICLKQAALFDDFYQFYCGSDLGDCVVMKEEEKGTG